MSGFIISFLLLLLAAAGVLMLRFRSRNRMLKRRLDAAHDRNREIGNFLNRFSSGLREENGVEGAMHGAARHVAEQAEAESVAIYDFSDGDLRPTGVCGAYPLIHGGGVRPGEPLFDRLRREKIRAGRGFLGSIVTTRLPELVEDASADPRFSEFPDSSRLGSVMAAPLLHDDAVIGVVCAVNNRRKAGAPFSESQFERLRLLAGQVIMVRNLVRAYSEIRRRERIDQELEFARNLQMSLLPPAFPAWDQFSVTACTRACKEVNGDFYDFVEIDEDRLLVLIGDASGKGIPACMLAAMTRSFARSLADHFTTLGAFLKELNDKLHRDTEADRFITLGCCLLDRKNSLIEFARAGHTDLISFIHRHIRVTSPDGTALGILPGEFAKFDTICTAFLPGTSLMMFSDGLSEALNKENEEFGMKRLVAVFEEACREETTPQRVIDRVFQAVGAFEVEQTDDQTIVLIRHIGAE